MSQAPVIAFGQQPCGFFPKRFLVAKILTARRLQREMGGEIVFFYHDADHDPRETRTTLRHKQSHQPLTYNLEFENKIQRKFSPLFLKRVPPAWHRQMSGALGNYVDNRLVEIFQGAAVANVADFCLGIYQRMLGPDGRSLLEGIRVVRSGDAAVRERACAIGDFFADVPYEGETVRAKHVPATGGDARGGCLQLHEGGPAFITLPMPSEPLKRAQISPTRDSRLVWMQSVLGCTHYVAGLGERDYLHPEETPEIAFVTRDAIENQDEAWTELPA